MTSFRTDLTFWDSDATVMGQGMVPLAQVISTQEYHDVSDQ